MQPIVAPPRTRPWTNLNNATWVYEHGSAAGLATAAAAVPVTGTAHYDGDLYGITNVKCPGDCDTLPFGGTIALDFDFSAGTLGGAINPVLDELSHTTALAPLAFTDTVYATGSTSFSGRFATALAGPNQFSGLFAGPAAEELIGQLQFPFTFNGETHTAAGAFVGKR